MSVSEPNRPDLSRGQGEIGSSHMSSELLPDSLEEPAPAMTYRKKVGTLEFWVGSNPFAEFKEKDEKKKKKKEPKGRKKERKKEKIELKSRDENTNPNVNDFATNGGKRKKNKIGFAKNIAKRKKKHQNENDSANLVIETSEPPNGTHNFNNEESNAQSNRVFTTPNPLFTMQDTSTDTNRGAAVAALISPALPKRVLQLKRLQDPTPREYIGASLPDLTRPSQPNLVQSQKPRTASVQYLNRNDVIDDDVMSRSRASELAKGNPYRPTSRAGAPRGELHEDFEHEGTQASSLPGDGTHSVNRKNGKKRKRKWWNLKNKLRRKRKSKRGRKLQPDVPTSNIEDLEKEVKEVQEVTRTNIIQLAEVRHAELVKLAENTSELEDFSYNFAKVARETRVKKQSKLKCCGLGRRCRICWYICACEWKVKRRKKDKKGNKTGDTHADVSSRWIKDDQEDDDDYYRSEQIDGTCDEERGRFDRAWSTSSAKGRTRHDETTEHNRGIFRVPGLLRGRFRAVTEGLSNSTSQLNDSPKQSLSNLAHTDPNERMSSSVTALHELIKRRGEKKRRAKKEKDITNFAAQYEDEETRKKVEDLLRLDI